MTIIVFNSQTIIKTIIIKPVRPMIFAINQFLIMALINDIFILISLNIVKQVR